MIDRSRLANGDSNEYWQGAREGRLVFQKCRHCNAVQFPPRVHCASCWESGPEWIESRGVGTIESLTIVRRAPIPSFRAKVPYVVVAVSVDEGPRMITNLLGEDALEAQIGDTVEVTFVDDGQGNSLPQFQRARR